MATTTYPTMGFWFVRHCVSNEQTPIPDHPGCPVPARKALHIPEHWVVKTLDQAAKELHIPEHWVVKTLVMETEDQSPLLVLMHGDQAVSTRKLTRAISKKKVLPVRP